MTSKIDEFGNLVVGTITERGYLYYGVINELGNRIDYISYPLSFSDSIIIAESKTNDIERSFDDSVSIDDLKSNEITRNINEQITIVDTKSFDINKFFSDKISVFDETLLDEFGNYLSNIIDEFGNVILNSVTEFGDKIIDYKLLKFVVTKPFVDSTSLSENRNVDIERNIVDVVGLADTKSNSISRKMDDESISVTDVKTITGQKVFVETIGFSESKLFNVTKYILEPISVIESKASSVSRSLVDKMSVFDGQIIDELGNFVVRHFDEFGNLCFGNITEYGLKLIDSESFKIKAIKKLVETTTLSETKKNSVAHSLNDELEVDDAINKNPYKLISDLIEITEVILEATSSLRMSNAYTSAQKVRQYTTAIPIVKKAIAYLPDWGQER